MHLKRCGAVSVSALVLLLGDIQEAFGRRSRILNACCPVTVNGPRMNEDSEVEAWGRQIKETTGSPQGGFCKHTDIHTHVEHHLWLPEA